MRAIDADALIDKTDDRYSLHEIGRRERDDIVDALEYAPTIQPEIVRCRDCKHHLTHKCMDSMPIERCDLGQTFYDADVDFCSLAEKREVTT